jgi:Uma2 family endonuclease
MDDGALHLPEPLTQRRFTSLEFQTLVEAGFFAGPDERVELVEGRLIVAPMDGGAHLNVGARIGKLWWPKLAGDPSLLNRMRLFVPGSMRVLENVASAPDAMLAPPHTVGEKRWPAATEAFLAIEISDTTLAFDEGVKKQNYAKGGLQELWIVRIPTQDVRICRGPRDDGSWASETIHRGADTIAPLAAPELAIAAHALFED